MMRLGDRSVFGKSSEITLGRPIPPHSRNGVSPPAPHRLQRTCVRVITPSDAFLQVLVLQLDDLIGGTSMDREVTWSTQLLTGHCLHESRFLFVEFTFVNDDRWNGCEDSFQQISVPSVPVMTKIVGRSGLRDADEVARGVAERAVANPPGLGRRLLEHLGARRANLLEGGVEVVRVEDRSLQRSLHDE